MWVAYKKEIQEGLLGKNYELVQRNVEQGNSMNMIYVKQHQQDDQM